MLHDEFNVLLNSSPPITVVLWLCVRHSAVGDVSLLGMGLRGAFLTRASSLLISSLVGLFSKSMACTKSLNYVVSAA